MTATAYRLLRGYLARSIWVYAIVGTVQFCLAGQYWVRGIGRVTVPAVLLGLWGIATALKSQSLVWRSVPLSTRDASIFRWWAIVGAPGLFVIVLAAIGWADQVTGHRVSVPAPTAGSLMENVLVGWASVGLIAALPAGRRWIRGRILLGASAVLVATYATWLIYGVPRYSASPTISAGFVAAGLSWLVFSAAKAGRGELWRWPDISNRSRPKGEKPLRSAQPYFGVNVIFVPILKRTAAFALLGVGVILLMYRIFPGAGDLLFWCYFIGTSTAGLALTYQVRSSIQTLRVLPLSAARLAGMMQVIGALPGIASLGLALLLNRMLLHLKLDPVEIAIVAMIIIGTQALPLAPATRYPTGPVVKKLIAFYQRIFWPAYFVIVVVHLQGAYMKLWWFKWPLAAAGIVLCAVGYYVLVRQLRAGIRPSSNETVFSPRLTT